MKTISDVRKATPGKGSPISSTIHLTMSPPFAISPHKTNRPAPVLLLKLPRIPVCPYYAIIKIWTTPRWG